MREGEREKERMHVNHKVVRCITKCDLIYLSTEYYKVSQNQKNKITLEGPCHHRHGLCIDGLKLSVEVVGNDS